MRNVTALVAFLIILITVSLNIMSADTSFKGWVTLYVILVCIERTWETFFTSKGKKVINLKEDWTLLLLTLAYVFMLIGSIVEFFVFKKSLNLHVAFFAFAVQFLAFRLRWWGMKSLGNQWTTSIMPITRIKNRKTKVIKKGPYKYLRHPIYLGVLLDVLAIPLVLNAFYIFLCVIFIYFPLQLLRAKLEERKLIEIFTKEYRDYKSKVWGFIPKLLI